MKKLFIAFLAMTSMVSFSAFASKEPPCNHESLDDAWGDEDTRTKDDNHCGHHHHCG